MKLLFIGNSHTYKNDLPELVSRKFRENGIDCGTVMLAQPGWTLTQHSVSPEVSFNIRFGGYDYVVLQEHAHPFEDTERYLNAVKLLSELAKSAGSIPLIYGTWARKAEPDKQAEMSAAYERAAKEKRLPAGRRRRDMVGLPQGSPANRAVRGRRRASVAGGL